MRIRTIKPEFWKHQRMAELPAETRLLAIGLLNYADDEGYFDAHPALIRGELMPYSEKTARIPKMLEELSSIGFLSVTRADSGKQIGHITNFLEHQRINRPTASKHSRKTQPLLTESSLSPQPSLTASSLPEGNREQGRERKGVVSSDDDEPELTLESPENPPMTPPTGSEAKKKKGGRERNEWLDALAIVGGGALESVTGPLWAEAARALKTIREVCPEVTPAQITAAAAAHRAEWPKATCSPSSLAKHWSKFGPQKKEGGGADWRDEPPDWRRVFHDIYGSWPALPWAELLETAKKEIWATVRLGNGGVQ